MEGAELILFRVRIVHESDEDAEEYAAAADVESKAVAFGAGMSTVRCLRIAAHACCCRIAGWVCWLGVCHVCDVCNVFAKCVLMVQSGDDSGFVDDISPKIKPRTKKPIIAVALTPLQNILQVGTVGRHLLWRFCFGGLITIGDHRGCGGGQPFRMVSALCMRFCGDIPGIGEGTMLAVGFSDCNIDVFATTGEDFIKKRVRFDNWTTLWSSRCVVVPVM